jgi:hypothetical protein
MYRLLAQLLFQTNALTNVKPTQAARADAARQQLEPARAGRAAQRCGAGLPDQGAGVLAMPLGGWRLRTAGVLMRLTRNTDGAADYT